MPSEPLRLASLHLSSLCVDVNNGQDDMDDLDHVLNYLRQEYSYRIWALVGHSRGISVLFPSRDTTDPGVFRRECCLSICRSSRSIDSAYCQLFRTIQV
jgi:hypothetical protein